MQKIFFIAAAVVFAVNGDGTCRNYCSATCTMSGDPHITNFAGQTFHSPHGVSDVTLYEMDAFKLWGPITNVTVPGDSNLFQVFYSLHVGDEEVKASEFCHKVGDSKLFQNDWRNGDFAFIEVTCETSSKYPEELGLFLNMQLTKTDVSSDHDESFQDMEAGSSGFCVVPDSSRRRLRRGRRGRRLESETVGTCANKCAPKSLCVGKDDPHITTFFGQSYNEEPSNPVNLTVYEIPGNTTFDKNEKISKFKIWVETWNSGRTYAFHFGNQEVRAKNDCPQGDKTSPIVFKQTFDNGDLVSATVQCTYGDHNMPTDAGTFFNWQVDKLCQTNDPNETFKSLEMKEGTFGLCISNPNDS